MSPAPRWPVVLFDFDGTLLNTIDGIVASYIYTWQTVSGRQVVRSEILPWIGRTLADVFADEDPANAAELEDVYLSHNAATLANAVRQYDGISELAQELVDAGIRTGVVTSKRRRNVLTGMQLAGLPSEMVLACAMDDTDRHKPDPTPLLTGLAALDAPSKAASISGTPFTICRPPQLPAWTGSVSPGALAAPPRCALSRMSPSSTRSRSCAIT